VSHQVRAAMTGRGTASRWRRGPFAVCPAYACAANEGVLMRTWYLCSIVIAAVDIRLPESQRALSR
jgi:hypothetical protein